LEQIFFFGNIQNQVSLSVNKLNDIQKRINDDGYTDNLMQQENLAKIELESVLNMEEAYWHEKVKVKWHNEGDRNTAFFHRINDTIITEHMLAGFNW
jgi:hypothetical protein